MGIGQLVGPHKVQDHDGKDGTKEVTAEHVIIAVGAKPTQLPGAQFDGKQIITSREAMTLPTAAQADGDHRRRRDRLRVRRLLQRRSAPRSRSSRCSPTCCPIEDDDVSILLERIFAKRGINVASKTKTDKVEKTGNGVKLTLSRRQGRHRRSRRRARRGRRHRQHRRARRRRQSGLEIVREPRQGRRRDYKTNLENVWAVGDCIAHALARAASMGGYRHPDLAHVAHHEAVNVVERIFGVQRRTTIDYKQIPGCTYTHPQVASMGMTEKKAPRAGRRDQDRQVPLQRQRPRPGRRRNRRLRQADLRRASTANCSACT